MKQTFDSQTFEQVREFGERIDFGKTASDYGKFRAGFPDQFFDRLFAMGVAARAIRALDHGTGTGTIARGLALRGCEVTGLDRSESMVARAAELDRDAGVSVRYVVGAAEETGLPSGSFELVAAGQCWHWFDSRRASAEARRVLKPGGRLVIANFDWIPLPGNVADVTEKLIEQHNPAWKLGGGVGIHPQAVNLLVLAGFRNIESFSFDLDAPYTHESWRGRIRASAGVGAMMTPEQVERFDSDLARVLDEKFPGDPLPVLHRTFAAIGTAP